MTDLDERIDEIMEHYNMKNNQCAEALTDIISELQAELVARELRIGGLIEYLRTSESLDAEKIHNLILDLEAIAGGKMNKSDIIKAAELACEGVRGWDTPMVDYARAALEAAGIDQLLAAAELLKKVEVLPEGSELIEGDVIKMDCSAKTTREIYYAEYKGVRKDYAGTEYKMYWAGGRAWKNDDNVPIQIIQRNGKPVITRGGSVSEDKEMREAFEAEFDRAYNFTDYTFATESGYCHIENEYCGTLNQEWVAFKKGFQAAYQLQQVKVDKVAEAVTSISKNSCCGDCQEAKLVAQAALNEMKGK